MSEGPGRLTLGGALFAVWAWVVLVTVGASGYLLVLLAPAGPRRWQVLRVVLRTISTLTGVPLRREGELPPAPYVLVINHASFIDGAVLIAAVPEPLEIAVGAVFATKRIAGPMCRALGCVFVGAPDEPARAQLDRLATVARRGHLAVFPEGHLARGAELDHFHDGAFLAAVRAGVAVVPVGISGSARVLPPGSYRAHRTPITVRFGPPLAATGVGFREARRLSGLAEEAVRTLRA